MDMENIKDRAEEVLNMIIPKNVVSMIERKLKKMPKVIKGLKRSMAKKMKIKANRKINPDNSDMNEMM